ncbi:ShlB/FhaC/HecB family hemolysin secretion/activation protein [Erwinia billingiae]|uniref:ShlB/FhaC/HecB family hemolysin secretion/activation protein n=1 Tax=Erwinia billingiae TaxID=182337 RepID=UPI000CFFD7F3|nr:ShlB/FhaC/HecB family hemolysin secretion/activation protein [Erwinia billingiae]PRB62243.1 hypothetical protein CQ001_00530 [Erwinia billingiae]
MLTKKITLKSLCAMPLFLFQFHSYAASVAERDIDQFLREQNVTESQDAIEDEKKIQSAQEEKRQQTANDRVTDKNAGPKYLISKIEVSNDDLFATSKERNQIISSYQGTKMGRADIIKLIRELTNFYIGKGYSTSLVSLERTNLNSGILKLTVLWGKIESITINGKSDYGWRDRLQLFAAVPVARDGKLNIQELDQGLENMLKVSPKTAIKVKATEKPGFSVVDYSDSDVRYFSFGAGLNNSGTEPQGDHQYYLTATGRNILGVNDSLSGRYSWYNMKDDKEHQYTAYGSLNLPYRYWNLDLSYLYSNYENYVGGTYGRYHGEGTSRRLSAKVSRLIGRDASGKFSAWAKVEKRYSTNFIENYKIAVSSKNYSNVSTGINYVGNVLDGWFYGDLSVVAGTPWFNASWTDDPDLKGYDIDFVKYVGYMTWKKNIASIKRIGLQYEGTTTFQYTNDTVVSSEQITVGDEYSVRGFKNDYLRAASGAVLSNNINFPVAINAYSFNTLTPFIGYDISVAKDNCDTRCNTQTLSGAAVGIKVSNNHFSAALTSAWPVSIPDDLKRNKIDRNVVYYNMNVNF